MHMASLLDQGFERMGVARSRSPRQEPPRRTACRCSARRTPRPLPPRYCRRCRWPRCGRVVRAPPEPYAAYRSCRRRAGFRTTGRRPRRSTGRGAGRTGRYGYEDVRPARPARAAPTRTAHSPAWGRISQLSRRARRLTGLRDCEQCPCAAGQACASWTFDLRDRRLMDGGSDARRITIHTPADFAGMRAAGRLAAETLDFLTPHVRPGVTTGAARRALPRFHRRPTARPRRR